MCRSKYVLCFPLLFGTERLKNVMYTAMLTLVLCIGDRLCEEYCVLLTGTAHRRQTV